VNSWRRPPRRRVRAIRDRLRELYGRPPQNIHGDPIHELVLTVLSQNTSDRNRDVAYARLRERFPGGQSPVSGVDWEAVRDAPLREVADAIRPGGLADTKAPRIQQILRTLSAAEPGLNLDWLRRAPRETAIEYLVSLPGVGRKTAACVLLFAFGRPEVPVDVHVQRVGGRLGLLPAGGALDAAHDEILAIVDPEDAYELHMNLIRHGREICRPRPRCELCGLRRMCPYWRELRAKN
jgi:endonuclease-3